MLLDLAHTIADYTICGEGNVSERQTENTFLIKASGTSLHTLSEEDLVVVDNDAQQLYPEQKKPSIEVLFHAWIMKHFPEINYIAHTHPPKTTQILCSSAAYDFACQRWFPDQIVRNGVVSCRYIQGEIERLPWEGYIQNGEQGRASLWNKLRKDDD